jgi:type IV pilus assembly protein PilV
MMRRRNQGFSLLEVLVSVVIFSVGLMGMAGLLMVSVRTNHSSYLRSQAGFLAQSMADRMRANMPALWTDAYNLTYPVSGTAPACNGTGGCNIATIVTRDSVLWSGSLRQFLPAPAARIACTLNAGAVAPSAALITNRAPYNGLCTITITWAESSLNTGAGANTQTFAWVFQP